MTTDYTELDDLAVLTSLNKEAKTMIFALKKVPNSPFYITNFRINGKIINRSTGQTNKKLASGVAESIWVEAKAEEVRPSTIGSKSLSYCIDEWSLRLSKKGNPRNKEDIRHLANFLTLIGDKPLGKITRDDLIKARESFKGKAKGQTINRKFIPLMAVFNMAVDEGWISFAPIYQKLAIDSPKLKTPFTTDEINALIKACHTSGHTHLENPILFSLTTGFRLNEIRQLRKNDIMFCKTKIVLRKQKNGTENQIIPLNKTAQTLIKRGLLNHSEYVFSSPYNNDGCLGDFKKAWISVRKIANLSDRDFHTLRHTAITNVAKKVRNVFELQDYSRHKSVTSLERYRHYFENKRAIAEYASFPLDSDATIDATR